MSGFDPAKITVAVTKAFLVVEGDGATGSKRFHDTVAELNGQVVTAFTRRLPGGGTLHIEDIQDRVELALMRDGHHKGPVPTCSTAKKTPGYDHGRRSSGPPTRPPSCTSPVPTAAMRHWTSFGWSAW